MEMIQIFNKTIELFVTGFFTGLVLLIMSKVGLLPIMAITYLDPNDLGDQYDEQP